MDTRNWNLDEMEFEVLLSKNLSNAKFAFVNIEDNEIYFCPKIIEENIVKIMK